MGICFFVLSTINDGTMVETRGKYIYGLAGLAQLIGCSKPTAHKIKESGRIPFAQIGKKLIFDEEKVIAALSFEGKGHENG